MSFRLNSQAPEWPYEQVKDNANAANSGWSTPSMRQNNPVRSNMVLFLDVDGVLAHPGHDLYPCPGLEACTEIAMQTKCDVVISSGWQFNPAKVQQLRIFLETCGFERNQVHLLKDLLEKFYGYKLTSKRYNIAPSTLTRSIYIRAGIKFLQRLNPHVRCMILDDMHLSSTSHVKVLSERHLPSLIDQLTETIFAFRSLADTDREEFLNNTSESIPVPVDLPPCGEEPGFPSLNISFENDVDKLLEEDCKTTGLETHSDDICTNSEKASCNECCAACHEVNQTIRVSVARALYDTSLPQDQILFGSVNCLYGILNPKDAVDAAMPFVDDVIVKALWHESFQAFGADDFFRKYRDAAYRDCWKILFKFVQECDHMPAGLPDLESYFRRVNPYHLVTVEDRNAVIQALAGRTSRKEWRHTFSASPSPDRKTAD